ncbi:lytic transglycosylase domain-containing protein [Conexibacter sp. CPCC 206217]|uniref:lytic transglycosylase domain-containing protein n=1 Tax=Conexibacter sp. CPCC 206217 TaxID=3064574 RepID=UPI0027223637|nr:lytic transglycosylase domain-containing protein [Conexibacter sp. CPCC 206217]MDO8211415.1 lytic transglycosylase domain-containing protein [Conexibacter sp. CPCC 206217]
MSVAAVEPPVAPGSGAQAAIARIAELQQLVAQANGAQPAAPTTSNGGATFPAALAGAAGTTAPSAAAPPPFGSLPVAAPTTAGAVPTTLGGTPSAFDGLIVEAAQRHGLDPALLKGLIRAESDFDPGAGSSAGAAGLTQLMPGTASTLGVTDRLDPAQSIEGGAKYLRQQLDAFGGDVTKALAAYNAGPGAVQRYNGVPPYAETQAYVQKVQVYADEYRVAPAAALAPAATVPPTLAQVTAPGGATAPLFTSAIPTTGSGTIT